MQQLKDLCYSHDHGCLNVTVLALLRNMPSRHDAPHKVSCASAQSRLNDDRNVKSTDEIESSFNVHRGHALQQVKSNKHRGCCGRQSSIAVHAFADLATAEAAQQYLWR